jgi:phosphatidylserine synthase
MVGLGGLTGTFTVLFYKFQLNISYLIAILIVISGLTGYARLKLNSHTHAQIYAGFGLGLVIMTVFLFFLL